MSLKAHLCVAFVVDAIIGAIGLSLYGPNLVAATFLVVGVGGLFAFLYILAADFVDADGPY